MVYTNNSSLSEEDLTILLELLERSYSNRPSIKSVLFPKCYVLLKRDNYEFRAIIKDRK